MVLKLESGLPGVVLYEFVVIRDVLRVVVVHELHCAICLVLHLLGLLRESFLVLVLIAALSKELGWHWLSSVHFLLSWLLLAVLGVLLVLDSTFDAQLVHYTIVDYAARLHLLVLLDLS